MSLENENNTNDVLNLKNIISTQFFKLSRSLLSELELSFDYISHDKKQMNILEKIRNDLLSYETDKNDETKFENFYKQTLSELKKFQDDMCYIVNTEGKIKTNRFGFMSKIKLFHIDESTYVDFGLFNGENKNTKKTLITYLWNIYNNCLYLEMSNNDSQDDIITNLQNFVKSLKTEESNIETIRRKPDSATNAPGLDSLLSNVFGNTHLLELANDISKNIQENNIDPINMLTSMMSGNPDKNMTNLLSNITNKLESKFENGELDKNELEETANNFLSSNSGLLNNMPMLDSIMKNMVPSMKNNLHKNKK